MSVDADQDNEIADAEVAVAMRFVGVEGAVVSVAAGTKLTPVKENWFSESVLDCCK